MEVSILSFASDAVTRRGLPPLELLQSVRLVNVMLRGSSPHTLLTVSLAMLLFAPSTLGWRGVIDCARRCHLALATGAHCPLSYVPQSSHSHHHCHHQESAQQKEELRCGCPLSSSPTSANPEGVHFLLSPSPTQELLLKPAQLPVERLTRFVEFFFSPPDPPPRRFVTIPA